VEEALIHFGGCVTDIGDIISFIRESLHLCVPKSWILAHFRPMEPTDKTHVESTAQTPGPPSPANPPCHARSCHRTGQRNPRSIGRNSMPNSHHHTPVSNRRGTPFHPRSTGRSTPRSPAVGSDLNESARREHESDASIVQGLGNAIDKLGKGFEALEQIRNDRSKREQDIRDKLDTVEEDFDCHNCDRFQQRLADADAAHEHESDFEHDEPQSSNDFWSERASLAPKSTAEAPASHSDYILAEKLQEEEDSLTATTTNPPPPSSEEGNEEGLKPVG